jgi:hypothetical protein
MKPAVPNSEGVPTWSQRLGAPAVGNAFAALSLVVAVAAGIGLLRQGIFWLIFGYGIVATALLASLVVVRRLLRIVTNLRADVSELEAGSQSLDSACKEHTAALAMAHEEIDASEAGYSSLRAAVIQTARWGGADVDDFDGELASALRQIARRSPIHATERD